MSKIEIDTDIINDLSKALGLAFNEFLAQDPEKILTGNEIVLAFDHTLSLIKAGAGRRKLMATLEA